MAKNKRQTRERKLAVLKAYGGECVCCGESTFEFLSIDHVRGGGDAHRREIVANRGYVDIYRWLKEHKCPQDGRFQLLCFNCNMAKGFYGYCPHRRLAEVAQ